MQTKDRPWTDQTFKKLVSYDSYNEFVMTQESTTFNVVLVHN